MKNILVTGSAGFIGAAVCEKLLSMKYRVTGIDNFSNYYDVNLKKARIERLRGGNNYINEIIDITNKEKLLEFCAKNDFQFIIHLAAQPGVRYSISNPHEYGQVNLIGFLNILEAARHLNIKHLVYASSSGVYGGNNKIPFSEKDSADHPLSLYAATKKANELMAHSYSHLYNLPTSGLRFFTVYGPWGRPDMAPTLFAKAIFEGRPIDVFNCGSLRRDFTYIDDIVEGIIRVLEKPPQKSHNFTVKPSPAISQAPWRVFNIGNQRPVELLEFIEEMELAIGKKAVKNFMPMQDGDVISTFSDTTLLEEWVNFKPNTALKDGMLNFISWTRHFYNY
jgi:UDP-glucuronate 4-epimerase